MHKIRFLLLALFGFSSAFAAETSLMDELKEPLELRTQNGEESLVIKPSLYGVLMLKDTLRLVKVVLTDYQGKLTVESKTLLERIDGYLQLPSVQFIERGQSELGLTEKSIAEKSLDARLKSAQEDWGLASKDVIMSQVALLLRTRLLEVIGPELFTIIENARPMRMKTKGVQIVERYDVKPMNLGLDPNKTTVDVDVHICDGSGFDFELIVDQLKIARKIFDQKNVQLRLRSARKVRVPDTWLDISEPLVPNGPRDPILHERDPYSAYQVERQALSSDQERVFSAVVRGIKGSERAIQIITLRHSMVRGWSKEGEKWEYKEFPSSAVSFPGYFYGDQVPKNLRGVIAFTALTSTSTSRTPKVYPNSLAHEIGHTLINVSHEGRKTSAKFHTSQGGYRDLMTYGLGCDIPSGESGRWQSERLQLSPFIHWNKNGKTFWNADFAKGGYYDDPIYGKYIVR